jgi:hypothetical protein
MTIQDLGDIGDLIGGIAVVATLIYLAAQVRQNTAMITAQTVQASVDATQRVLLFRAEQPALRALFRKARTGENLTQDELEVLASYLQAVFMNFQARLMHHERGLFDQSVNESYELILRDYLVLDFVQRWWSFARELYGAAFRDHCDALIEELARGEPQPVPDWTAYARRGVKDN